MTIDEMKKELEKKGIDYSNAKRREDYLKLLNQDESTGILGKVQAAKIVEVEQTVTKKGTDTSYLAGRDYGELTAGERLLIREKSPEYENIEKGIKVQVTNRLTTKWRIVKLHDKSFSKMIKGEIYFVSQDDYKALKDVKVKVKTEATKNKCCGQAIYEEIALLEVLNG